MRENVAVTVLTLTNTGAEPTTRTLIVRSPITTMPAALGSKLTGTVTARYRGAYSKALTFTLSTPTP